MSPVSREYQGQRQLQKDFKHAPRGNHAVEGAEAVVEVLREACDDDETWMAVTLAAIMRHHTPGADDCWAFALVEGGRAAVGRALAACDLDDPGGAWQSLVKDQFRRSSLDLKDALDVIQPTRMRPAYSRWLLYLLMVRILRLADQRSGRYWRRDQEMVLQSGEA